MSKAPKIDVTLEGGPAHGQVHRVGENVQIIEVYHLLEEPEPPTLDEQLEALDGKRKAVELKAITLIYERAGAKATTAKYKGPEA